MALNEVPAVVKHTMHPGTGAPPKGYGPNTNSGRVHPLGGGRGSASSLPSSPKTTPRT